MTLEGKLREDFFEWYANKINYRLEDAKRKFEQLTEAEQFGSIQEFADTKGYYIAAYPLGYSISGKNINSIEIIENMTRKEAQQSAINELAKIYKG